MKQSWRWCLLLTWSALIWYLTSTPQLIVLEEPWFQTVFMMFAHFSFFGIQAVLFRYTNFTEFDSILLTSLYGAVIEANQLTVPGRSADPLDWLIDTLGALSFLFVFKKLQSKQ